MISRINIERDDLWGLPFQAVCIVAIGAFFGILLTFSLPLAILLAGLVFAAGLLTLEDRLVSLFVVALAGILLGYMFFGRGFAYAGVSPLFVSELVLGLAALALLYTFSLKGFSTLHVLILVFMVWGLLRTVPYITTYGVDALRDAVVWGYAIFALMVSNVISVKFLERLTNGLARLIPFFLLWTPVLAIFTFLNLFPVWPQSGIAMAIFEPGDTAVHLAGLSALVISGMYFANGAENRLPTSVFWTLALVGFGFVAAVNRAGMLTIAAGLGAAFFLWPSRQIMSFLTVVFVVGVLVLTINPNLRVGGVSRQLSPDQIIANVNSIFGSESNAPGGLQDTKNWREQWWDKIWDYTVNGPYFFTGKGYGVNLSNVDGFQTLSDGSSRSPHNGHFTILARSGVPGLVLWLTIQAWFGVAMYRAFLKAKSLGADFWARIDIVVLIYWMAMLINMSFDVYLEGPQGGIWFWTVIGVGMGALRLQSDLVKEPRATQSSRGRRLPQLSR